MTSTRIAPSKILPKDKSLLDLAPLHSRESGQGSGARRARRGVGWSGLSCWPDRQTNQRNQRDQIDQKDRYAALLAAFSEIS